MTARYPVQHLLDAANVTAAQAAHQLHVSYRQLQQLARFGLPEHLADRWACRLGLHPANVWPEWVDDGLTALDLIHLNGGWRTAWLWKEAS